MSQQRRGGRAVKPLRASQTRDLVGNDEYELALEVLSRMRQGWSLTSASAIVGINPRTAVHYIGSALEQDEDGSWEARPNDRLHRRMRFLDEQGTYPVEPLNAREASKLSDYWRAVNRFVNTGDTGELRPFRRKRLRTRQGESLPFLTDRHQLVRVGRAGELRFEDLYQH